MFDIPFGDTFRIEAKWEVTAGVSPNNCRLIVGIGVYFVKKTWMKNKIESQSLKETRESYNIWLSFAKREVAKLSNPYGSSNLVRSGNFLPSESNHLEGSPMETEPLHSVTTTTTAAASASISSTIENSSHSSVVYNDSKQQESWISKFIHTLEIGIGRLLFRIVLLLSPLLSEDFFHFWRNNSSIPWDSGSLYRYVWIAMAFMISLLFLMSPSENKSSLLISLLVLIYGYLAHSIIQLESRVVALEQRQRLMSSSSLATIVAENANQDNHLIEPKTRTTTKVSPRIASSTGMTLQARIQSESSASSESRSKHLPKVESVSTKATPSTSILKSSSKS